jgi:hypothetical protein
MNGDQNPNPHEGHQVLIVSPHGSPIPTQPRDEPPARVQVAMGYLYHMTAKTISRIAVGTVGGLEEFDGMKLEKVEVEARDAACKCLRDYFNGNLPPSKVEETMLRRLDERPSAKCRCPNCQDHPVGKFSCQVCKGMGYVEIVPARTRED